MESSGEKKIKIKVTIRGSRLLVKDDKAKDDVTLALLCSCQKK